MNSKLYVKWCNITYVWFSQESGWRLEIYWNFHLTRHHSEAHPVALQWILLEIMHISLHFYFHPPHALLFLLCSHHPLQFQRLSSHMYLAVLSLYLLLPLYPHPHHQLLLLFPLHFPLSLAHFLHHWQMKLAQALLLIALEENIFDEGWVPTTTWCYSCML